jgi:hypothetical protein
MTFFKYPIFDLFSTKYKNDFWAIVVIGCIAIVSGCNYIISGAQMKLYGVKTIAIIDSTSLESRGRSGFVPIIHYHFNDLNGRRHDAKISPSDVNLDSIPYRGGFPIQYLSYNPDKSDSTFYAIYIGLGLLIAGIVTAVFGKKKADESRRLYQKKQ